MIARLLVSPNLPKRVEEIRRIITSHLGGVTNITPRENLISHPDILYFQAGEKLGIEQARAIKEHFSLKPFQAKGRQVIIEDADSMTTDAQNALLKTLEEPPEEAILILGVSSEDKLLPTVLSRCEIQRLTVSTQHTPGVEYAHTVSKDIEMLLGLSIEQRFEYIEKLKEREEFLRVLVSYFRKKLIDPKITKHDAVVQHFVTELLQAEQWTAQNVNIRAILEYLMLVMPRS